MQLLSQSMLSVLRRSLIVSSLGILSSTLLFGQSLPADSAPVPEKVAIARPTAADIKLAEQSLAKFIETADPAVQAVNQKYPGLIAVRVPPANSAIVPNLAQFFQKQHNANLAVAKQGDMMSCSWEIPLPISGAIRKVPYAGKPVLDKYLGDLKVANFGIAGDTTQGVLYRLQHGEGEGFSPKAVMLMIGTNNTGRNTRRGDCRRDWRHCAGTTEGFP